MIINTLFGVSLKEAEHIPKNEENKNSSGTLQYY